MGIRIYVSTFGFEVKKKYNMIPIEVGAKGRDNLLYEIRDDIGDNISDANEYFGELTGLYWIWKNVSIKSSDYIGFAHYNKSLNISLKEIKLFLSQSNSKSWIVRKKCSIPCHKQDELDVMLEVLKEYYPDYYQYWMNIYELDGSSENCNAAQLFITTAEEFDKYCAFIFGVLFEVKKRIGEKNVDRYEKRYCAFLGERLLSVYLLRNNCNVKEVDVKYSSMMVNFLRRISKKLNLEGGKVYLFTKAFLGNKSSYK